MTVNLIVIHVVNGIAIGMVYAMLSIGLSVIKGLLNVPNFAHGAFFALGAYLFYGFFTATGLFWVSLPLSAISVALVGAVIELSTMKKLYGDSYLFQLLLLFGVALIIDQVVVIVWGDIGHSVMPPNMLRGGVELYGLFYPKYLLFLMVASAAIVLCVYLSIEKTHFGAIVRAAIEKEEMASSIGINVNVLFTLAFAIGAGLAALAGALATPVFGATSRLGMEMLAIAFVVVVIGGLGSIYGAIFGGLLVGLVQSLSAIFIPTASTLIIFVTMILVLMVRPQGLLGER